MYDNSGAPRGWAPRDFVFLLLHSFWYLQKLVPLYTDINTQGGMLASRHHLIFLCMLQGQGHQQIECRASRMGGIGRVILMLVIFQLIPVFCLFLFFLRLHHSPTGWRMKRKCIFFPGLSNAHYKIAMLQILSSVVPLTQPLESPVMPHVSRLAYSSSEIKSMRILLGYVGFKVVHPISIQHEA